MEKQIKKNTVYNGIIFQVDSDDVLIEKTNQLTKRDIVHHNGGVGMIAINQLEIILVKQFRYAYQEYLLEIPAGKLEKNEDPKNCGIRELEEETHLRANQIKHALTIYPTPGYCDEKIHLYYATDLEEISNPHQGDDDEFIEIIKLPLDTALSYIQKDKIKDAKTIIGIYYALSQDI